MNLAKKPLCSVWDSVKTLIEGCDEEAVTALRNGLNAALRALSGGIRSTPVPLLHAQTGIGTLSHLIEQTMHNQIVRMMQNPKTQLNETFQEWDGRGYELTPLRD